jgi:two-component system, response regulator YesN
MTTRRAAILIVDDEPDVCIILQRILQRQRADHDILVAADAAAALSLLSERAVALLFTDLSLPGMSGEQLVGLVKAQWPATRIIMISGIGELSLAQHGQALHLDGVLAKPFSIEEVRKVLDAVLPSRGH